MFQCFSLVLKSLVTHHLEPSRPIRSYCTTCFSFIRCKAITSSAVKCKRILFFTYLLSLLAIVMMTMLCVCVDFRYVAPKAPHLSTAEHQFNCSLSNFTVITTLQYIWMLSTVHVLFVFFNRKPQSVIAYRHESDYPGFSS